MHPVFVEAFADISWLRERGISLPEPNNKFQAGGLELTHNKKGQVRALLDVDSALELELPEVVDPNMFKKYSFSINQGDMGERPPGPYEYGEAKATVKKCYSSSSWHNHIEVWGSNLNDMEEITRRILEGNITPTMDISQEHRLRLETFSQLKDNFVWLTKRRFSRTWAGFKAALGSIA